MDLGSILAEIAGEVRPLFGEGKVADYIPALARVPREQFGIAVRTADGQEACAGDAAAPFSI